MKFRLFNLGIVTLSSLVFLSSEAFAQTVYRNPRIQGLEVDRCINSYLYPEGCSQGATEHAANEFCQYHGHSHATRWSWQDQSTDYQRSVYKLLEESGSTYFRIVQGSYIFTEVSCEETIQHHSNGRSSDGRDLGEALIEEIFDGIGNLF